MAATVIREEPPIVRRDSPSPESTPTKALRPKQHQEVSRCLSVGSSISRSSSTDGSFRDSMGSDGYSRHSSASFYSSGPSCASSRMSVASFTGSSAMKRRGYSRPEGTDFAASARQRESVLSLGSIAHLQYYFARTGLLDGKGGQLARKKNPRASTLDLSSVDSLSGLLSPTKTIMSEGGDSPHSSTMSSPDLSAQRFGLGGLVDSPMSPTFSPTSFFEEEFEEPDPTMPPPTMSTYKHRVKHVPRPPTHAELKADLNGALDSAANVLVESKIPPVLPPSPSRSPNSPNSSNSPHSHKSSNASAGFFEVQGMQILDHVTLAIRAAKIYYTSHENPERLDAIKSEKEIRNGLFSVLEVLKHMATRRFTGGMRPEEEKVMAGWIQGIRHMLQREEEMEEAEQLERASWIWLQGDWTDRTINCEIAFFNSMMAGLQLDPLPPYTPITPSSELPTPFLAAFQNGFRLVQLHNAAVRKSRQRFGAIGSFHTDTLKPYRCADNLRYWIKAAELRWEVMLKVDVLAVVYNNNRDVWIQFEAAIWKWCHKVRTEITKDFTPTTASSPQ